MRYTGRPGISPALAALVALGRVRRSDRVLDVGCGTGTDAVTLARWGFRRVQGIDPDAGAIGAARARARRLGLERQATFHAGSAERLGDFFPPASFDVVLHTLVANNLVRQRDRHFREVARVLRPDGLLLLHERVVRRFENAPPGRFRPLPALAKHFSLSPGVATHLAERPSGASGPSYARVVLWVGTPKATINQRVK